MRVTRGMVSVLAFMVVPWAVSPSLMAQQVPAPCGAAGADTPTVRRCLLAEIAIADSSLGVHQSPITTAAPDAPSGPLSVAVLTQRLLGARRQIALLRFQWLRASMRPDSAHYQRMPLSVTFRVANQPEHGLVLVLANELESDLSVVACLYSPLRDERQCPEITVPANGRAEYDWLKGFELRPGDVVVLREPRHWPVATTVPAPARGLRPN
jgi:hypothetical protein